MHVVGSADQYNSAKCASRNGTKIILTPCEISLKNFLTVYIKIQNSSTYNFLFIYFFVVKLGVEFI